MWQRKESSRGCEVEMYSRDRRTGRTEFWQEFGIKSANMASCAPGTFYCLSVARSFSSTASSDASERSVACKQNKKVTSYCRREVRKYSSYLDVFLHSYKRLLERIKAGRVQHLLLDLGGVWAPWHQEQLLLFRGLKTFQIKTRLLNDHIKKDVGWF